MKKFYISVLLQLILKLKNYSIIYNLLYKYYLNVKYGKKTVKYFIEVYYAIEKISNKYNSIYYNKTGKKLNNYKKESLFNSSAIKYFNFYPERKRYLISELRKDILNFLK